MNDRFNFRCFDTDIQKFIVGFRLCDHYKWPNGIIEQCTGLKDENGQLIYEGDILFHPYFEKGMVVRFNKLHLYFGMQAVHNPLIWMPLFPGVDGVFRIIGNIHEKPKLLEDK